jgi:hypothetical protein
MSYVAGDMLFIACDMSFIACDMSQKIAIFCDVSTQDGLIYDIKFPNCDMYFSMLR